MKTKTAEKTSIHSFRARSMREALALVRDQLGPQAQVLHTREVDHGMLGRLWKSEEIEVVAREGSQQKPEPEATTPEVIVPPNTSVSDTYGESFRSRVTQRLDELQEMTERLEHVASRDHEALQPSASGKGDARAWLDNCGVEKELADELLQDIAESDPESIREAVVETLGCRIRTHGPIEVKAGTRRVVALVGPTGVGKTTTLAKLAAGFRIHEKKRVGLITVDTFRIAAVDQLRTYAQIMDLPMEVASTPREMRDALDRLRDCELVLIDSAGRSPCDAVRLQELKTLLQEARPDEMHLVLSATTSTAGLQTATDRFAPLGADALVLTKVDESPKLGHLARLCVESDLPVSYVTDGQDVPEDIHQANRHSLAKRILSEEGVDG